MAKKSKKQVEAKKEFEASTLPDKSNEEVARQKRLSGATMNMKFMKRSKKEHPSKSSTTTTTSSRTKSTSAAPIQSSHAQSPLQPSTTSNNNHNNNNNNNSNTPPTTTQPYKIAQPIHMFGITGSILGRRSFGGMNEPMQEAWKTSLTRSKSLIKGTTTTTSGSSDKERLTDEVLLQRYQDMVDQRSKSVKRKSRTRVSNLK